MIRESHMDGLVLERLRQGDHQAFMQLYDCYHKRLYQFSYRYLHHVELSQDVVHEVFMKIWLVREGINPEKPILPYIYRITRNFVYQQLKRLAATPHAVERYRNLYWQHEQMLAVDQLHDELEYDKYLQEAIASLSERKRQVFTLCRTQGKSYKEAAEILGISVHTVKEYLLLAVKSIREYLYKHGDIVLSLLLMDALFS